MQPVRAARVLLGTPFGYLRSIAATASTYTDAKSGQVVYGYHARMTKLRPDRFHLYLACHEGAEPEIGSFRTGPRGRARLTFTSFGDQGTPNGLFFQPPQCRVIVSVGPPDPVTGKRPPVYAREQAPWSAVRNPAHAYGFAAFTVDPGTRRGGMTTMTVTYYDVLGPDGTLQPFETFTLRRPRSDARRT